MMQGTEPTTTNMDLGNIPISFRAFWVYDDDPDQNFALDITDAHVAQGFTTNNNGAYNYHPLIQDGSANVSVTIGQAPSIEDLRDLGFTRATALPLEVHSSKVRIDGSPGEEELGNTLQLANGSYQMLIVEGLASANQVRIGIFLTPQLAPPPPETAANTFLLWDPSLGPAPTTLAPKAELVPLD